MELLADSPPMIVLVYERTSVQAAYVQDIGRTACVPWSASFDAADTVRCRFEISRNGVKTFAFGPACIGRSDAVRTGRGAVTWGGGDGSRLLTDLMDSASFPAGARVLDRSPDVLGVEEGVGLGAD